MTGPLRLADSGPRDASMIVPVMKGYVPPSDGVIELSPESSLISDALVGDLKVFYAFDLPGHFEYVSEHDRERLQLDLGGLREMAIRNLTKRRSKPEILRPSGAVVMLRIDGDLEASLLLVDHLWPQLARSIAGEIVVGVPSGTCWPSAAPELPMGSRLCDGQSTGHGSARRIRS